MKISLSMRGLVVGGLLFLPATAFAQGAPDIPGSVTQGSQIDDIIRQQDQIGSRLGEKDNEIDGEAGIYVLRVNDIFFLGASAGVGYSQNPLRTIDDVGGSFSTDFGVSAGVQTKLGEAVDVGLVTSVSGIEYDKAFAPSSRTLNGAFNVGTQIAGTPLYVGASGFGGFNYDESFRNPVAFYGGSASVSAGFPIGKRTIVRPAVSGTRQWSDISENNSVATSGSLSLVHAIAPRLNLAVNGRVTRTWFDNFFEDVTFVKRKDWQYGGGLSATYVVNSRFSMSVSGGYEKRSSTFFLSEYDSFEAGLALSVFLRF